MRVLVVGAGIGGLAAAVGLQRAGADVHVLERADVPRTGGSGLSLWGNGFVALDALGLGDAVREVAGIGGGSAAGSGEAARRAGPSARDLAAGQRRPDGTWLARLPSRAVARLAVVHRADLHDVLLAALRPGTVRYGVELLAVADDGGEVTVQVAGATAVERADLVVAADGIRSRVRSGWPGDPGLRYAGYTAWRGVTAGPVDLRGAAGETLGRGLRFGLAPLPDGRVYWFGVASVPPGGAADDEHGAVRRLFGGWHDPVPAVVAATVPGVVSRLDIHDLAGPLPTFRRGRCVLLGDAAHAMTPDRGQGGGQAREDAATLARLCEGVAAQADPPRAALERALRGYDELRRPRAQRIARRARIVGAVAQARGPVTARGRDLLLRLTPPSAAARQLLALQEWQPPAPPA